MTPPDSGRGGRRSRSTAARPPLDGSGRRLGGAFLGDVPESLQRASDVEAWLSTGLDVQTVFEPWATAPVAIADLFDRLAAVWEAGRTPLLTWEPFTRTPEETPDDLLVRIVRGRYDEYLGEWGRALSQWLAGPDGEHGTPDDRRILIRPMHEANGDWYPWAPSVAETPASTYVRAWRRIHREVTKRLPADAAVSWIWAVNHVDVGDVHAEALFPGDDAVDWVGVDGFNWGTSREWSAWRDPAAVFGEMLDRVAGCSARPLCVPEFGCGSERATGPDPDAKSAWLADAFATFVDRDVRLAGYFGTDKETDWAVFGGERGANTIRVDGRSYRTYPGFRRGYRAFVDA
ncbi:glycoside hydrolase family 26 protein [Halobaculum marinum]|uniref:Glycoside hydrolase family 26 protein n=1 Tax=Halobaculum marinum TaxID=3031996 RepID=A0ABD5X0B0_9EURY|nr:glycosyl hydrolase [Halobaculum sp. DT55]